MDVPAMTEQKTHLRPTMTEALAEVFGHEMCPCGCGPRATLHERGFTVADLPDEERLAELDEVERLLRKGQRDAMLLDGRHYDDRPYEEALSLLALLRERATL